MAENKELYGYEEEDILTILHNVGIHRNRAGRNSQRHLHGHVLRGFHVRIIDGAGRDVVYTVYAVGLTTSDHVIYVTSEALYHEWDRKYDESNDCKNVDGSWTEEFVQKSDYWWEFDVNARKRNVLLNKENVLLNVLRIITEKES